MLKQKRQQAVERALVENSQLEEATNQVKEAINVREERATQNCGTCQCSVNKEVAELIDCSSISDDFLEIVNVNYRVAILKPLLIKKAADSKGIIIKDTHLETVEGLEGNNFKHLVLEKNTKLQIKSTNPIELETLELRMTALYWFVGAFKPNRLLISNTMASPLTKYATSDTWNDMCYNMEYLVLQGELSDIVAFRGCSNLKKVTFNNVISTKPEIIPSDFLQNCRNLEVLEFFNASQASVPAKFLSSSNADDLSLFLEVKNSKQYSFDDKSAIKYLNDDQLDDREKDILTSPSNSGECAVFCSNNDCQKEKDEVSRKNCAICVRGKDGPNEQREEEICHNLPASTPPPTPQPSTVSELH